MGKITGENKKPIFLGLRMLNVSCSCGRNFSFSISLH